MSYRGPKAKLSRRLGVALTPKSEKFLSTRPHPPGMHGRNRRPGKLSDYGRQLQEKQRLRFQYNISENQLRNYYLSSSMQKGNTVENLARQLERRLDVLVLRTGLARSIFMARQLVVHGHITVNGSKLDRPSYVVAIGDVISVRDKSREMEGIKFALQQAKSPAYLKVNDIQMTAELSYLPTTEEIPIICDMPLVVEFYSR